MQVTLKPWTIDAKAELIRICNAVDRTYLTGRMPYPYTESNADWWLDMIAHNEGENGVFRAIFVGGECAGSISLEKNKDVHCREAEIGYYLLNDFWGKGFMTEAVSQLFALPLDSLNIARVTGYVSAPNIASRRVLEKSGFELEGIMRKAIYKHGAFYDQCVYGRLLG